MAFSVEDETYLALYGVWKDASDDERYAPWATEGMLRMSHLSTGCQLADENLRQRRARFLTDEHRAKLKQIRAARDPEDRFYDYAEAPLVVTGGELM